MKLTPSQFSILNYIMPDALMYQSVELQEKPKEVKVVTKEMSKEDFVESEHPRDSSGKFTDKLGGGAEKLSPEKGSWGGGREHAGRLPKEAHNAVPKLKERFRKQNPEANEDQINQMVVDYAKTNLKPDVLEYMENPDNYYKKMEENRRDAMLDKYRKTHYQGKPVKNVDASTDTSQIRDETRGAASRWKEALEKEKSIQKAKEIYDNEEATQSEINVARLITGAATVASAVGLWALLRKRPNFIGAGLKEFEQIGAGRTAAERAIRSLDELNKANPVEMIKGRFIRHLQVIPKPPKTSTDNPFPIDRATQIYQEDVGSFKRVLSKMLGLPDDEVAAFGPSVVGYGPTSRYKIGDKYAVDPASRNFRMQPGDFHRDTGMILVDADGKPDLINIAIAAKIIPEKPNDYFKLAKDKTTGEIRQEFNAAPPGLRKSKDGKKWEVEAGTADETKWLNFLKSEENGILKRTPLEEVTKPGKSAKMAVNPPSKKKNKKKASSQQTEDDNKKGKRGKSEDAVDYGKPSFDDKDKTYKTQKFVYTVRTENLPPIGRRWTQAELDINAAAVNKYKSWSEFLEGNVYGPLSRRILAKLTVATGASAGGMFYFQQEIERAINEHLQEYKAEREAQEEQRKLYAKERREQQNQKKSEIERMQAETKLNQAQAEAARQKVILESIRQNVIEQLVANGFRKVQEGAVTDYSRTISVLNKMAPDARKAYVERALTRDLLQEFEYPYTEHGILQLQADILQDTEKSHALMEAVGKNLKKELERDGILGKDPIEEAILEREENIETITSPTGKKVINRKKKDGIYDIILKAFQEETTPEKKNLPVNEVIERLSTETAKMISDMSESCSLMIENGVPGHSRYEAINDLLVEIYAYMKDRAKVGEPENTEISQKSVDKSFEAPYMSTQDDSGGGLFTGRKKPNVKERCPKCQKMATEETIDKCENVDCPYSFVDMIEEKN